MDYLETDLVTILIDSKFLISNNIDVLSSIDSATVFGITTKFDQIIEIPVD